MPEFLDKGFQQINAIGERMCMWL